MNILKIFWLPASVFLFTLSSSFFAFAQTVPTNTTSTTLGPSISNVVITDITDTSARIDIDSDEMVQGYVEYGTTEQYGVSTPLTSEFSTSPSFALENLAPETLYHYRVVIMDSAGNVAITGDETFTTLTPPEQAPITNATTTTSTSPLLEISNTKTASISTSTARITWQTNKDSDSQVEYGTTTAYGSFSSVGTTASTHAISLFSLTPGTKYYYRAISKNASNETAYSPMGQFTTLVAQTAPSSGLLTISDVSIMVATSTATISWTTSKLATSDIQYGLTTSYGSFIGKNQILKTSHTRTVNNLETLTLYHFRIVSTDNAGNTVLGKDRTFTTTNQAPQSSETVASSDSNTLSNIAEQGKQSVSVVPKGGGGLPVAPFRPLLLKVTPLDSQVSFEWIKDKGGKNGGVRTLIVKKEGTSSVLSRIDGEIIYDGPSTTFTDNDVENGKEYHYALYSYGTYGRFTTAARFKAVPQADKEQVNLSVKETAKVASLTLPRDLFRGKQGADVTMLQSYLAQNGYYPEALITGYFGPLTQNAVIRFQKLNNISPAVGYMGVTTRTVLKQE